MSSSSETTPTKKPRRRLIILGGIGAVATAGLLANSVILPYQDRVKVDESVETDIVNADDVLYEWSISQEKRTEVPVYTVTSSSGYDYLVEAGYAGLSTSDGNHLTIAGNSDAYCIIGTSSGGNRAPEGIYYDSTAGELGGRGGACEGVQPTEGRVLSPVEEKMEAALNPDTLAKELEELATGDDWVIVAKAAANPNLPLVVLSDLAQSYDENIRASAASNYSASSDLLTELSNDKSLLVLQAVAHNKNTPADTLEKLATIDNEDLARAVITNANVAADVVNSFVDHDAWGVRMDIINSGKATDASLTKLTNDPDRSVRLVLAADETTPSELLDKLAQDEDADVVEFTKGNPNYTG